MYNSQALVVSVISKARTAPVSFCHPFILLRVAKEYSFTGWEQAWHNKAKSNAAIIFLAAAMLPAVMLGLIAALLFFLPVFLLLSLLRLARFPVFTPLSWPSAPSVAVIPPVVASCITVFLLGSVFSRGTV